ncbi:MAG TPA: PAS domain-containing methyl-accepting chemotaxis protein [Rhodopila sp.]|nr:PAS domain-containing methyl-accepting chemotaxis protein [Rhodopila sp.]
MFRLWRSRNKNTAALTLEALGRSQAIVEFDPDGIVLTANQKFLDTFGYTLAEIKGKHHRLFVEAGHAASADNQQFWQNLRQGQYQAAQFKRIGKGGREIWIEASYNPIRGRGGETIKIVKFASDVTAQKLEYANLAGQIAAIHKSLAAIEFDLDGVVLTANQKFLDAFGYTLAEIKGKQHRQFVEAGYATSADYQKFWATLRQGQYQAAQFKRIGKGGRVVWIQASYNVILDLNGKPFKVVKFATDVTPEVVLLNNLKAIVDQNFSEIDHALSHSGDQAQIAAGAVKNTSDGVSTMAASAEEMASSVRQIADTMTKSKIAVERAHQQLAGADQAIQRFSVMSVAMAGIVGLIRDIAAQINLLALNATIESARAGDAGKGFAVVASEVKNLANQAGNATDKIASEIESLQMVADETIAVLQAIGSSINSVLEYVTATADAVEEQSVVSQEMSAAMQETAGTVTAINDNMVQISASVQQVGLAVDRTRSAAQILVK